MTVQQVNAQLVSNLAPFFVGRNEAQFQLSQTISLMQTLPGLRGFWPMAAFNSTGDAIDQSGHGHTLTYNGNPTYNADGLIPYIDFDGTGDYLSRTDEADLDFIGTESYIASALRGLTIGGWFYPNRQTASEALMIKADGATFPNLAFQMLHRGDISGDPFRWVVSDGSSSFTIDTASSTQDTWQFISGRLVPSASLDAFLGDTKTSNTTSIPASLTNSASPFQIGARNGASIPFDGRASMCFLCATALPDSTINLIYQTSRGVFGV